MLMINILHHVSPGLPRRMCKDRIEYMTVKLREIEILLREISYRRKWGGSWGKIGVSDGDMSLILRKGEREKGKKLERSILDLHAVKKEFSKAVRKYLSQNQPPEYSHACLPRMDSLTLRLGAAHGKHCCGTKMAVNFRMQSLRPRAN